MDDNFSKGIVHESDDRFRTLVETISHVIFTLDDRGHFTFLSPQCEDILGLPPESFIGKPITAVVVPDDRDKLCRKYREVKAGGSYPSDYQVFDKDGRIHHVRAMSRPVRDDTGKIMVVGVISEIRNWQAMDDALRTSEQKVRALVEYSKDGILLTDECGAVVEWSPALEQITGLPRTSALGQHVWEIHGGFFPFRNFDPGEKERLKSEVCSALKNGTAPWLDRRLVSDILHPDGKIRYIESIQFIVPAIGGNRLGAIIRDITDWRETERALQEANRKLNLMSSISRHDISNQLTIFMGYLSLL